MPTDLPPLAEMIDGAYQAGRADTMIDAERLQRAMRQAHGRRINKTETYAEAIARNYNRADAAAAEMGRYFSVGTLPLTALELTDLRNRAAENHAKGVGHRHEICRLLATFDDR